MVTTVSQQPVNKKQTAAITQSAGKSRFVSTEQLVELYKKFSPSCGGRKEDYFGLAYIARKFDVEPEQVLSNIAFGGTQYGIDGYYLDKSSSTFHIFTFRWSDDHMSFKDPLDKLGSRGLDKIFVDLAKSSDDPPMIISLKSDLFQNWRSINNVVIDFVFKGDPVSAEQSKVLSFLRETIEDRRTRIESYFSRIDNPDIVHDIIFQYSSNNRSMGHSTSSRESIAYAVELGEVLKTIGKQNEMIVAMFPLETLHRMYSELGERFFEKNIRSGLGEGSMTNNHIKKSLHNIASGAEPSEHFTLYHLGVTLTAQHMEFEGTRLRIVEPRILNGAQTVKILKEFADEDEAQIKHENVARIKVMTRIIKSTDNDFLRKVTLNNNRQNPIMPWNLRANDLLQVAFEEHFAKLGIYYERRENAFKNTTDEDLEIAGVNKRGVIEIKKFAQTLLAMQGHVDRMSEIAEVFEKETWYRDTFKERYLEVDPRKLVLLYKIQFRLPNVIREIKSLGTEKYTHISKAKNLLWCLCIQGVMNDNKFTRNVENYGSSPQVEAGISEMLKSMASSKLRFIVGDVFDGRKYRTYLQEGKLSFLTSKTLLNDCLETARKRYDWEKLYV